MASLRLSRHPQAAAALALHAGALLLAVALVSLPAWVGPQWGIPPVAPILGGLLILAGSSAVLLRTLKGVHDWDGLLAGLTEESVDPFGLPTAAQSTPAALGWNRLVNLGQRWQSLSELESSVAQQLRATPAGNSGDVVNALADGVVAIDAGGRITLANNVFASICGADSPTALVGRSLSQALGVGDDVRPQLEDIASKKHLALDVQLAGSQGQPLLLRCIRRPRFNEGEQLAGHVWTIRDVTQQRLAESMRERFLTTATHEFRTPLANIRAHAELLEISDDVDPEQRKKFYNIIQSESVRLARLIDDLLDISRMQAGALALDLHETDLGRLAEEASAKVLGEMQAKSLQFRCEFPPKFPKANVDKSKLTAALVNLLGNAAKYTPAGGEVAFRVEIGPSQADFVVVDTGIGIAPDELSRVFERFFRSNDDRVRDITGSGLGLSLTQEVARLHGGDVTVESTLNQGSTFRLSIPIDATSG